MATLGLAVAGDLAAGLLPLYIRGDALSQTMEDKPTLAWLEKNKKPFGGGLQYISDLVQFAYMSDNPAFLQGYTQDDQLNFSQAANMVRTSFYWKELSAGLVITWTELKQDGISIGDHQKQTTNSDTDLFRLTDVLTNRMQDFAESLTRAKNRMFWLDGSQDAKATPGITSILTDTPDVGVTGGLNRATYNGWRHRVALNLAVSAADQTLCRFLQADLRQLKRFGGKPDYAACGSEFIRQLETEVYAKGILTQEGFTNTGATTFGMAQISQKGLGVFTYDPTLDELGLSNRAYVMDSRRLYIRPMDNEDDKTLTPERPYNYQIFLHNVTWTGALCASQLNCHAIYGVPAPV